MCRWLVVLSATRQLVVSFRNYDDTVQTQQQLTDGSEDIMWSETFVSIKFSEEERSLHHLALLQLHV